IEKLLNLDEKNKYLLITCGEEVHFAYNRVGLTEYFEHRNVDALYLNPPSWYASQEPDHFQYHLNETVTSIQPDKHLIHTSKNRSFRYDRCIIATGSTAALPSYTSFDDVARTKGVFVYRNIADLEAIIEYASQDHIKHAVVVGGGLLGLEAAKAVHDLETISHVSIVNRQAYPLSRQLDADAGEMVMRKIEGMGVDILTNTYPCEQICTPESGSSEDSSIKKVFAGLRLQNGAVLSADLVIYAIGISPRDELAKMAGIECASRGGIVVNDFLETSAKDVYAIGECANWNGNSYGLIAPGIEMADILAFNLTQTESHAPRKMNSPDLSTKLKLMGVDVASFGDYFADRHPVTKVTKATSPTPSALSGVAEGRVEPTITIKLEDGGDLLDCASRAPAYPLTSPQPEKGKPRRRSDIKEAPVKCLVYNDPFSATYKKYIFTADGKHLLGGMMIGDVSDFIKLVAIVKKKKPLDVPPSQFIIGSGKKDDGGDDLDDDAQVCSCHVRIPVLFLIPISQSLSLTQNVSKGDIAKCVKAGEATSMDDIKKKTKLGTGCGGCIPFATKLFSTEMKRAGRTLNTNLCRHFALSRQDIFSVVKVRGLRVFTDVMRSIGVDPNAIGCEVCKPAIGSILSSLYNESIIKPEHHQNQDTNDRYMANIQRDGTFSVVPRIAAGEITPDGLIVIGSIAKKYGLYTKITGGQRIDMFGAKKDDLPAIWEELNEAGFESGHAYGKSLRTVKSCVGSTWCRYGVGDSVGLAIQLEKRYKGVRSPHKFKGGVSGCVRECAEAQSKDFGVIATDKGWNIHVGGNGGANPRHAELLAKDVPPSKVIRIIDRYLAYYIMTADRLQRTARWIESLDGGIDKLRKVVVEDSLGICSELESFMQNLVGTYEDEWATVVKDPTKRQQFRQFVNTAEKRAQAEIVEERGQHRPADWPKEETGWKFSRDQIVASTLGKEWEWVTAAKMDQLTMSESSSTSFAIKRGDTQIAVFHVPGKGFYATQQMCPHRRTFVLDHGIIGDTLDGDVYVSCPLHKRNFVLQDGRCLNDSQYTIATFEMREFEGEIQVLLPPEADLDEALGTEKWMVRKARSEVSMIDLQSQVEIASTVMGNEVPRDTLAGTGHSQAGCGAVCGDHRLDW
ncbi:hypothetical protein CVT24_013085, partial [Panaeolus cyanescens]